MKLRRFISSAALFVLCTASAFSQSGTEKDKGGLPRAQTPVNIDLAGRFRVTLTGFTVNRQSDDNILESDGKGDEVYIIAELAQYDSYWEYGRRPGLSQDHILINLGGNNGFHGRGNLTLRRSLTSVVMGDVNNQNNPPRIQAGSASNLGGLRTGDRFPAN